MTRSKKLATLFACFLSAGVATIPMTAAASSTAMPTSPRLQQIEDQLLYARSMEALIWASPALAVYVQNEAGRRDLGLENTGIIYWGSPMDHRWGGITYNNQSPYWVASFNVKDEPIVVDVPETRDDARFFGSIHDHWWIPLEDFGPAGADAGKGGKYLVVGPNYIGKIPEGYIVLKSNSYEHIVPGRTIPRDKGQKGWDAAVRHIKELKIYPLSQAENPPKQQFIDGYGKVYDAQPRFTFADFEVLDRIVQNEPVEKIDLAMYGMLSEIGIEKGKEFNPTPKQREIMERAAKDAEALAIEYIRTGKAFAPFWGMDNAWGVFNLNVKVISTLGRQNFEHMMDYHSRFTDHFYIAGGMYNRFDVTRPAQTFYVMTAKDVNGKALDANKAYKISIPKDAPMRDFWSIIAYGQKSRSFIDSPKNTVSSNEEGVKVNADGSTDLYLSNKPVKGFEANTVIINPEEDYFLMFRLYGAKPELWKKQWKLGSPVEVK
jgi:hypothetical protein